jgi:hypothetical protein
MNIMVIGLIIIFMVMEFITGQKKKKVMKANGRITQYLERVYLYGRMEDSIKVILKLFELIRLNNLYF